MADLTPACQSLVCPSRPAVPHRMRRGEFRVLAALLLALPLSAAAFKVGVAWYPTIHEDITHDAMVTVMPSADPKLVMNVQSGVLNTDLAHFTAQGFHFDDSNTTNGGFDIGFQTLYGSFVEAESDATLFDANGNAYTNPLFMNPEHTSYQDMLDALDDVYKALIHNWGCLEEPLCPTDDIVTYELFVSVTALGALIDTDPDPDATGGVTIPDLNLTIPDFSWLVVGVKQNLDSVLDGHCDGSGNCYTLEQVAAANGDQDFQSLASQLRTLQYEYQAYIAWQHLGHAFHTTQDFFAHSNYVELAACAKGPPCDPNSYHAAEICDQPLNPQLIAPTAVPLPTDAGISPSPWSFAGSFNAATVQGTLNAHSVPFTDNFSHLQTGYFPCANAGIPDADKPQENGLLFCHTATSTPTNTAAGLNKDVPYANDELNHLNFDWAVASARRMSQVLFTYFLSDMGQQLFTNGTVVGPAAGVQLSCPGSASSAGSGGAGTQQAPPNPTGRKCGYVFVPTTIVTVPPFSTIGPGPASTIGTGPATTIGPGAATLSAQPVTAQLSAAAAAAPARPAAAPAPAAPPAPPKPSPPAPPPSMVGASTTGAITAQGAAAGAAMHPTLGKWQYVPCPEQTATMRSPVLTRLPPLARNPPLISPTVPHLFVRTTPKHALRIGETAMVTVDAFDARSGLRLNGLPVAMGSVRGTTGVPMRITGAPEPLQRCGRVGVRLFCTNDLGPMHGSVTPPAGYATVGASFAVPVLVPRLRASIPGGRVVRAGVPVTIVVNVVDAGTGQPVPTTQVLLDGAVAGPANVPLTRTFLPSAPLRPARPIPVPTGLSHGPLLVVRSPGYPDAFLPLYLAAGS